jgi:hypothetical protein
MSNSQPGNSHQNPKLTKEMAFQTEEVQQQNNTALSNQHSRSSLSNDSPTENNTLKGENTKSPARSLRNLYKSK